MRRCSRRFAKIGLVPGQDFDAGKLDADFAKRVPQVAFDRIMLQFKINAGIQDINGWGFTTKTGTLRHRLPDAGAGHRDRPRRQPAAGRGLSDVAEGRRRQRLTDGANKYVMHFAKGELPPVEGFWSLTMYDANYFFVPNPINRYSISARQDLKANADGSIDLYIQKDSPGTDKESELAAGAGRQVHPDDAPVLARQRTRRSSMAPGRFPP